MARNAKLTPGIQVFRGSKPRQDVYAQNAGIGCCHSDPAADYDKLGSRVRFDNALAHLNPTGANDKFIAPFGDGFSDTRRKIVQAINDGGVGTHISVLTLPTYSFLTGVGIHISAEEAGLTFDLVTRNGTVLPGTNVGTFPIQNTESNVAIPCGCVYVVEAEIDGCEVTRNLTYGDDRTYEGFGALGSNAFIDIFGRSNGLCCDDFVLEPEELALKVASMPASGVVNGTFEITVSVSYDVIHRAEA